MTSELWDALVVKARMNTMLCGSGWRKESLMSARSALSTLRVGLPMVTATKTMITTTDSSFLVTGD
ncbi:hypothetical protein F2Q70_00037218 [Brassica cretica]|uniref:Uncharacterized protein n=1 Tax=Brassica cretica TaxID=69181 RepID=A0A8S9JXD3_BRACR|nr:hypothetical protein F2Q70_00037218 [Brassica cretica]